MVVHAPVDQETVCDRLVNNPLQRELCDPALAFRVAAADIGMYAGEPNLLNVLGLTSLAAERVWLDPLRLCPQVWTKHPPTFVNSQCMAKDFHIRVGLCEGQLLHTRDVQTIRTRHNNRTHGIPEADELYWY